MKAKKIRLITDNCYKLHLITEVKMRLEGPVLTWKVSKQVA